jgi:lipopolysaccharide export system protein LptA
MGFPPRFPGSSPWCLGVFLQVAALILSPGMVRAQGTGECDVPNFTAMRWNTITTITGQDRILHFQYPTIRCPGGTVIKADSVTVYESTSYYQLWGNVEFIDVDSRLTSDQAQYFREQNRLQASGNAVLTTDDGSVITGANMQLVRAGTDGGEDVLNVSGGQPHATLYPARVVEEDPDSLSATTDSLAIPQDSIPLLPDSAADPEEVIHGEADTPEITATPEPEAERIPYEIDARQFILEGNRYFRATGNVVVKRDSLNAVADSLEYEKDQGALFLSKSARVTTPQIDLGADNIRLAIPEDEIREALATGDGVLEGEDLRLVSPIIHLSFTDGIMERLIAFRDIQADSVRAEMDETALEQERLRKGAPRQVVRELGFTEFPTRPYALVQDFALQGDSLEVMAPGEVLSEVWAIGSARGESTGPDSLTTEETPELIARDWLEGDTIITFFGEKIDSLSDTDDPLDDPLPELSRAPQEADSTGADYRLERLVARGNARSMYRMAPSDSTLVEEGNLFAIHYVVGDEITVLLNEAGEAEKMEVKGETRGIHLEPVGRGGVVVDSTVVPDTMIVPDTMVVPDTAAVGGARGGSGR